MNANRRKRLETLKGILDTAKTDLEEIASEERDAYDALPESLQGGEKGQQIDEIATYLEEAASSLEEVGNTVEEAVTSLSAPGR